MDVRECRVDRLAYGRMHIADVMSMPRNLAPDLWVDAPAFPVPREEALEIVRERVAREPGAKGYLSKDVQKPVDLVLRAAFDLAEQTSTHRKLDEDGEWPILFDPAGVASELRVGA